MEKLEQNRLLKLEKERKENEEKEKIKYEAWVI